MGYGIAFRCQPVCAGCFCSSWQRAAPCAQDDHDFFLGHDEKSQTAKPSALAAAAGFISCSSLGHAMPSAAPPCGFRDHPHPLQGSDILTTDHTPTSHPSCGPPGLANPSSSGLALPQLRSTEATATNDAAPISTITGASAGSSARSNLLGLIDSKKSGKS